jgi:hypothetical protein
VCVPVCVRASLSAMDFSGCERWPTQSDQVDTLGTCMHARKHTSSPATNHFPAPPHHKHSLRLPLIRPTHTLAHTQDQFCRLGACHLLVSVLRAKGMDRYMRRDSLRAAIGLAEGHSKNTELLVEHGARAAIEKVLEKCGDEEDVCQLAARALGCVVRAVWVRVRRGERGGGGCACHAADSVALCQWTPNARGSFAFIGLPACLSTCRFVAKAASEGAPGVVAYARCP